MELVSEVFNAAIGKTGNTDLLMCLHVFCCIPEGPDLACHAVKVPPAEMVRPGQKRQKMAAEMVPP